MNAKIQKIVHDKVAQKINDNPAHEQGQRKTKNLRQHDKRSTKAGNG